MSPGVLLLCFFGFAAAEIPSLWLAHDRRMFNNLPHNRHPHNITGSSYIHQERRLTYPMYHYDYRLKEKGHLHEKHQNRKTEGNEAHPYATGLYRSYGRGKATVPAKGATVTVFNSTPRQRVHKETLTARILTQPLNYKDARARMVSRNRRHCTGCPQNRAVVASRGNAQVVLPEPCPTLRWMAISGPKPGTLIAEGTHSLIGRLGYRGKICQYEYEVVVRHCGTFTVESGNANCTIDDAWGSICNIICQEGYELVGSSILECSDDLKWSHPTPTCKRKRGCPLPQTPDDVKIWCQIPDESDLTDDILPADTYCRFRSDGRQRVITCVDGYWVNKYARGRRLHRTVKSRKNKKVANSHINNKKDIV